MNKIPEAVVQACSFIKKRLQYRWFPTNIANFYRPPVVATFETHGKP